MTYTVIVTREGDDWLADVPELDGASTYASTLRKLMENVREVVILAADLDDGAKVDLDLQLQINDPAVQRASRTRTRRRAIERELAELRAETSDEVAELLRTGYSVRDTAEIVGITAGRVSQVANERKLIDA